MHDVEQLVNFCKEHLTLQNAKLGAEYFYTSLPLAVIDAVFSIQLKYTDQVIPVVKRYYEAYGLTPYREPGSPIPETRHTIKDLLGNIEKAGGAQKFSETVLRSKYRVAGNFKTPEDKILKAEAVYQWALILHKHGIESFADVGKLYDDCAIERELRAVKGQGGGASTRYLFMLCGNDDFCKPDVHILGFLTEALGRKVSAAEAQSLMAGAVKILSGEYPDMTVRLLDNIVWKEKSGQK